MRHVTVVLDDDPTGTQEVSAVPVLLRHDHDALRDLLRAHDTVFLLTNTRAMTERRAVNLLSSIYDDIRDIEEELSVTALVVQRGDSTMRGHIFAEIDGAGQGTIAVFCPAFPAGGRKTVNGVHMVKIADDWVNSADTEYARDPVFGYSARSQIAYVAEKGNGWKGQSLTLQEFGPAIRRAKPRTVLLPDVETDDDVRLLAQQIREVVDEGVPVVVRAAAPLAAFLAHSKSDSLLTEEDIARSVTDRTGGLLVVVGSHTSASGAQLANLLDSRRIQAHELATDRALADPAMAGRELAERAASDLHGGLAVISSERLRRPEHDTLEHGEAVMTALTVATRSLAGFTRAIITKGGITSAEIARSGLGKTSAWVAGQLSPGVSLWTFSDDDSVVAGPGFFYAIVPGNIGHDRTLLEIASMFERSVKQGRPSVDIGAGSTSQESGLPT